MVLYVSSNNVVMIWCFQKKIDKYLRILIITLSLIVIGLCRGIKLLNDIKRRDSFSPTLVIFLISMHLCFIFYEIIIP